ncbi:PREDICTED: pre-rRNA-processing protein TSR1 homolog isoform X2 [Polistes canadensis]|uniref:pre-rRNA-processing protein TSR1 homolog isoform X2 n=1 Tax=Polistes canadensis TaxID=91411 RepID=UPI00071905F5|nr:PREDICTED: pre-rRNA-processing protein TSR1 homolog isoform X2 [Polistes canadensis]
MGPTKNQETHRPGAFKQTNKAHKTGRHRSKGVINNEVKGKQSVKVISKQIHKNLNRDARRHQSLQLRKKKMEEMLAQKRKLGKGSDSAPILICIIPLQEDLKLENIVYKLKTADDTINFYRSHCGIFHMNIPRMKQRFSIIIPPINDFYGILDAVKVANTVLFVTSAINTFNGTVTEEIIDKFGNEILYACLLQGLPTSIVAAINVDKLPSKIHQGYKQRVIQSISKYLPEEKVFSLDTPTDSLNVLRRAATQKQRTVTYRTKRPYLLADQLKYISNESSDDQGTLQITGYLQGSPISVNGLIHIPGFKDFQLLQIDLINDPYEIRNNKQLKQSEPSPMTVIMDNEFLFPDMENHANFRVNCRVKSHLQMTCIMTLAYANPNKQESLESENIPDLMDAEQTWPTEEELAQAEAAQKKKIVKVVPKGTSAYQAAWIPDEDADLSECSENESEDKMSVDDANSQADNETNMASDDEEYETITISEAAFDECKYDQDIDMMEEKEAMEKINRAKLDAQFPDEIDTPQNMLAKVRFQKYRGLESFRTSPWDPKENLPPEYARIYQFENFDRTRKRIFKKINPKNEIKNCFQGMNTALPGWYIKLHVANVSRTTFTDLSISDNRPVIVFGLLPNEQKMSLLNIVLKHANVYQQAIKSKERLVFQCGFRRFSACPIFSQHTNGSKHKYERFFRPEMIVVASMYAPIIFPPCPVLCFIEHKDGRELIASGSVLSVNPDRIVVKRVVLSGHPFKVHKNSAIVRFMFFNREDINWFKPVQLRTKYGRRGHIKEPLGTHGHMKCFFNGQLKSQDTILMNLYKRVFPKWTYEPLT